MIREEKQDRLCISGQCTYTLCFLRNPINKIFILWSTMNSIAAVRFVNRLNTVWTWPQTWVRCAGLKILRVNKHLGSRFGGCSNLNRTSKPSEPSEHWCPKVGLNLKFGHICYSKSAISIKCWCMKLVESENLLPWTLQYHFGLKWMLWPVT